MRKLTWVTVLFTYFLMVWGNLVSATGSGLACPDWPLCHGTPFPTLDYHVVFEWGHRLLAACATILIFSTLYALLFSKASKADREGRLKTSGKSLLGLLLLQILLGGTTVLLGLSVAVSTIHLMVATAVFSGLIAVACVATWGDPVLRDASPKVRRLSIAALGAFAVQLALGALVRHGKAGLACANFPNCLDSFWPSPVFFETVVAFTHRWWGFLLLGVFVQLAIAARRTSRPLAGVASTALVLSLIQFTLGVATVLSGLSTPVRAIHAALGYALWGVLFYIAIRSGAFRWIWEKRRPASSRGESASAGRLNPSLG